MSPDRTATLRAAAGLSLAAAVSLGLARFAGAASVLLGFVWGAKAIVAIAG